MNLNLLMSGSGDSKAVLAALDRSLAIIEFTPDGKVTSANENFCKALGYGSGEIIGRHHSLFVDPEYARSPEYKAFWKGLAEGRFDAREYKRIGKNGRQVWIQASYNPVLDRQGRVVKVVKVATDITEEKLKNAEAQAKIDAISRAEGVIEFDMNGAVLAANENFLNVLGYRLEEIRGKHHRMFVDNAYGNSKEYAEFWERLKRGEYVADEFKRIGKGGKEVWIQASYNPIYDLNGRPFKVVKFATDVTERVRAVKEIGDGLGRLAHGDLNQRINRQFIPALESLRLDFNSAVEQLEIVVHDVIRGVDAMRSGTREIAAATDDLSKRTEQQAASLEETAAAVSEITQAIKASASGASEANRLASQARADAKNGGEVVGKAVDAIHRIEKSSSNISQIIGTIDEIAFQTNLLALNAGVEAARAGEAGRGFAVVASEVRALAQRSAEAAKEIKNLILASAAEVGEGVKLVAATGQSLERIVDQVVEINELIAGISDRAAEQSASLQQINTAINQMDQDTQKNAAMVEETTAASHSLSSEAETLGRSVNRFNANGASGADTRQQVASFESHAPRRPRPVPASRGGAAVARRVQEEEEGWQEF